MSPDWHALFAPLPEGARVKRKPVESIKGWESLTIEMSAASGGLRHVMVTVDAKGTPIAAGDWVVSRTQTPEGVTYVHENVGGRLEPNGSFSGTRWRSVIFERSGGDEAEVREASHVPATAKDIEAIQALVLDVIRLSST